MGRIEPSCLPVVISKYPFTGRGRLIKSEQIANEGCAKDEVWLLAANLVAEDAFRSRDEILFESGS
jgi:hypothetical protein